MLPQIFACEKNTLANTYIRHQSELKNPKKCMGRVNIIKVGLSSFNNLQRV